MKTLEFFNLTGSRKHPEIYALDMAIDGAMSHRLSSSMVDGVQRLTLKKNGEKIATQDSPRGIIIGQYGAREWAKQHAS